MTKTTESKIRENKGIYTASRVNGILNNLTGGDAHVEQRYFADGTAKGFKQWYVCLDTYRPGKEYKGRSPKLAAQNAGFYIN